MPEIIDVGFQKDSEVLNAFASEKITVSDAVKSLTAATYAPTGESPARAAIITVDSNRIRVEFDGVISPAATTGHALDADDLITLRGFKNIKNFRAIREGGADATIQITYLR